MTPISAEAIKAKIENGDVKAQGQRKRKEVKQETTTEKPKGTPKSSKPQLEPKSVFPTEGKLNKYGFIYLNDNVLTVWVGHGKGTEQKISIDLQGDKLVVGKA